MTNIRVSQESLEVLLLKYPNLRTSQVSLEVLLGFQNNSNLRVSQASLEVLVSAVAPTPTTGRVLGPPVQMI